MRVAHVGPPLARQGGPAGYLWQLAAVAARRQASSSHQLTFPPPAAPRQAPPASVGARARRTLGRMKRAILGAPAMPRPGVGEMSREGGLVDQSLRRSMQWSCEEAGGCARAAAGGATDVLFAHDPAVAEALLELRRPGQAVWLMLHSPMPVALYLTWSWGVPEWDWTDVAALPDVRRWIDWEIEICRSVDRVIVPCAEALGELARVDARYGTLPRVDYVLTGAAAPARSANARNRRDPSTGSGSSGAAPRDGLRRSFGLPEGKPVGLFLGTAQPYRGLFLLLDALGAIPSSVDGLVAVAGPARETLPAHPRVRALGPVSRVGDLLAAVDFAINVNQFSLFDLSVIEAAEAGCPMLLHAVGGNRHFADLGVGATMLPDLEPASIAAGLAGMFAMSPSALADLGRRSRACYERSLTPDHMWDEHMRVYSKWCAPVLSGAS